MSDSLPRELSYSMAIAELILKQDRSSKKLWEEKFNALKRSWMLLEMYASEYFDEDLLDIIMEKKARKILDASTIKDVQELGNPPKPQYTGNQWIISENSIPEEEMICWSKISQRGPLIDVAFKRYMQLFRECYGEKFNGLIGSIGGNDEHP